MLQPELKLRRDKIRSLMVSQGIDAALITCNANLIYTYGCVVSGYLYLPLHSPALLFFNRPVQRRYPFPCFRQPLHFEIPRLRADIQECADYPSDGWRQRRFGLLTPWQERC